MYTFFFFVLLTMVMAFLMNWFFGRFFSPCGCQSNQTLADETAKLHARLGETTEDDDISNFLG